MAKGVMFKYRDKDGTQRRCVAQNEDQNNSLMSQGKLVVTKLDSSYKTITENGEPVKIIKSMRYLTQIGFID